jgi:hypothetical protein
VHYLGAEKQDLSYRARADCASSEGCIIADGDPADGFAGSTCVGMSLATIGISGWDNSTSQAIRIRASPRSNYDGMKYNISIYNMFGHIRHRDINKKAARWL